MTAQRDGLLVHRIGSFVAAAGWVWLVSLTVAGFAGADLRRHHFETPGMVLGAGLLTLAVASWRSRPMAATPPQIGRAWTLGVPAAAAVLAFGWALWLGPLSDDYVLRAWAIVGDWTPATWPFVRPLPLLTWRAILLLGGGWTALHALNLLLHAIVSALTARLAATWLQSAPAGLAAGLIVAVFPASAEAVAWTAGVFDVMATAAVLAAVTLGVSVRRASPARDAALATCCAAGLLAKESAIVIPALLLLAAAFPAPAPEIKRARIRAFAISAAVAVVYLVARVLSSPAVAAHMRAWPEDRRAWKDLIVRPFASALLPYRTDGFHSPLLLLGVAAVLLTLVLIGVLIVTIVQSRQRQAEDDPPVAGVTGFAIAWILIGALPLLSQFFVSETLEGSRFLYLPAVGLALLLASPLAAARSRVRQATAAVCVAGLLSTYAIALIDDREVRVEAARTRDELLGAAGRLARERSCGTLTVRDVPDNVRGVYVFREGLREALADVVVSGGAPCTARWTNGTLVPEP